MKDKSSRRTHCFFFLNQSNSNKAKTKQKTGKQNSQTSIQMTQVYKSVFFMITKETQFEILI